MRPSFVPPPEIRDLRNLTRYRKAQIEERTREAQRLDKVLQDAGIKLSSVASDVMGVSGQAMLHALVAGERDPEALVELAKALRRKLSALREALVGRFRAHHALLVGEILTKLDDLDEAIGRSSEEIERVIAPFAPQVELLRTIPGVERRVAEALIAEIGVDMSRFGLAARLASWAGIPASTSRPAASAGAPRARAPGTRQAPRSTPELLTTLVIELDPGGEARRCHDVRQAVRDLLPTKPTELPAESTWWVASCRAWRCPQS